MTPLARYEMETIINYNAGEQTAIVYTRDKAVMPKSYVSYRKPRKLSEGKREQAREQMKHINSSVN